MLYKELADSADCSVHSTEHESDSVFEMLVSRDPKFGRVARGTDMGTGSDLYYGTPGPATCYHSNTDEANVYVNVNTLPSLDCASSQQPTVV